MHDITCALLTLDSGQSSNCVAEHLLLQHAFIFSFSRDFFLDW